ncbi:MAG: toll/interleukin-1 receptor domain-containing protein [Gemmatimonadales bacterium]
MPNCAPVAFLSHTSEDRPIAARVAADLLANGVQVFYAEWEIRAGDSIVERVNAGLADCTHFIVLATPRSIAKPWVSAEMDAGFIRRIQGRSVFVPLRSELEVNQLPPLLQALYSPSLDSYDEAIPRLIADLYGVSIAPPRGEPPHRVVSALPVEAGLSIGAGKVAALLTLQSENGRWHDPVLKVGEILQETGLTEEDLVEVVDDLEAYGLASRLVSLGSPLGFHAVAAEKGLFVTTDPLLMGWNPVEDARQVAAALVASSTGGLVVQEYAQSVGWSPRRLNPAIYYLDENELVDRDHSISFPYEAFNLRRNSRTRRFALAA